MLGQINNLSTNNFLYNFISLLNLGIKYIPSLYNNSNDYFIYLLKSFDNYFNYFNNNIFYLKQKQKLKTKKCEKKKNISQKNNILNSDDEILKIIEKMKKTNSYKNEVNNIPYQKEALLFRNKFIESLTELDLNCKTNLNTNQFRCFKEFLIKKPFKLALCDKNVGWAILNNDLYNN